MSKNILTNALAGYKAECEANNQSVVLDQFVFANIPDLDVEADISPDETLPPEEQIVGRFPVTQKGKINPNAVVYSIILGTDVGSFDFNAIYLVNSEMDLAGAIIHLKTQTKEAADPTNGIEGDTLTRNIITPYLNASELTQIVVDADTWQLDFNNRFTAIDERQRQNNLALYGDAGFIDGGYQVSVNQADNHFIDIAPGVAYVGGLKCVNASIQTLDMTGIVLPKTVYLVASFQGDITSEWKTFTEAKVADSLENTWIDNGVTYYSAPVAKLTTSGIQDLRSPDWRTDHLNSSKDPHPQYAKKSETEISLNQITAIMRQMEGKLGRVRIYMANDMDAEYLPILGQTITKADYPDYFEYLGITDDELTLPDWSKHPYLHQASNEVPAGTTLEQQLLKHAHTASSNSIGAHSHTIDNKDLGTKTVSTKDLGNKTTNTTGNHSHTTYTWMGNSSPSQGAAYSSYNKASHASDTSSTNGNHSHTVAIGSHNHTVAMGAHNHTMQSAGAHSHTITVNENGTDLLRPNSTAVVFAVKVKYLVPSSLLVA
ncbi:hypothetical protein HC723_07565 [Vibrio sp. S11_S32]|uniref:phage tail-collar fiber domain-containing protein n=1 Tax=Vibrio sp. S11_S32 TaxID=2720225 RepID=UPI001681A6DC|nr:phage tail protein [Vibrio sp. S11_S32]MBD1576291.1 hypothetical protein [Vibrio sp. S11_S32]